MGMKGEEAMNIHGPKWKWEWSPNSIAIVIGIIVTILGWGYLGGRTQSNLDELTKNVGEIRTELRRVEMETRRFEALEFRVTANERRATSTDDSLRTVEQSIVGLSSDMRLVREILERLERGQNGGRSHYENPTPFRGTP